MSDLEQARQTIERRIAELDPGLELIALERPAAETLRIYIDHESSSSRSWFVTRSQSARSTPSG